VAVGQAATWRDSVTVFRRATAATQRNWLAERNLAAALAAAGRTAEALEGYRASLAIEPDQFEVYYRIGSLRAGAGDWAAALPEFHESARRRPDYASARYGAGLALMKLGRPSEAEPEFREALALPLESQFASEAHNSLGVICAQRGDMACATEQWTISLQIQPANAGARANLARTEGK
jgi:Flp pilus assembly protein TadD